jgi:leucyl-tRNA synthetase
MQRQWIGQLEGALATFQIDASSASNKTLPSIDVFTSRAETINGVSFVVLAPDHAFVQSAIDANVFTPQLLSDIKAYQQRTVGQPEVERTKKDVQPGLDLGLKAINPINGERLPVYIASYVVAEVGTGAVMGVPAHDSRDGVGLSYNSYYPFCRFFCSIPE